MSRIAYCMFVPSLLLSCCALAEDNLARSASQREWSEMKRQLARPTSVDVKNVPLGDVLDFLKDQHRLQIVVDHAALDDLGLVIDDRVSIHLEARPLAAVLEELLHPLDLTWTWRRGVLVVTSEEQTNSSSIVRVYPVPDLLDKSGHHAQYDALIDAIISTIATDTWVENGGACAEVRPLPSANALVICQSIQSHLEIERLFDHLRHARMAQGMEVHKTDNFSEPTTSQTLVHRTYVRPAGNWRIPRGVTE